MSKRTLSAEQRVAAASQCAFELAIDSMHDTALQEALMRRNDDVLAAADAIRHEALESIKELRPNRDVFLLDLLRTTTDVDVRNAVLAALTDMRDIRSVVSATVDEIGRLLQDPKTKHHRLVLLYALGKLYAPIDLGVLIHLVIEETEEVQVEAIQALERDRVKHNGKPDLKRYMTALKRALAARSITTCGHNYVRDAVEILTKRLCAGKCGGCSCK